MKKNNCKILKYEEFKCMLHILSDDQQSVLDALNLVDFYNKYEDAIKAMLQCNDYWNVKNLAECYNAAFLHIKKSLGINFTIDYKTVLYKECYSQKLVEILVNAVHAKDLDTVGDILKNKFADVTTKSPEGSKFAGITALNCSILENSLNVLKWFFEHGISVNAMDSHKATGLMFAAAMGQVDALKCFVEHGADVNMLDDESYSALYNALAGNHKAAVDYLMSQGASIPHNKMGKYFFYAAQEGYLSVVKYLIEHDLDVDTCTNKIKKTGLMFAAEYGRLDIVTYLLEHGADANKHDIKGRTALTLAKKNKHTEVVEYLQGDVDAYDVLWESPVGEGVLGDILEWLTTFHF